VLKLRTFGGLSLHGPDGPITGAATQRRRLALLALLAPAGDQGVSRDKVLAYLWPEGDTERARHALAQLVYAVRRTLGDDALLITSTAIRLNANVVSSDVAEFEEALARGDAGRAAELYAGPFLDGFYLGDSVEFERWAEEQRARLAQRAARALETLAREAASAGNPHFAASWWRRLAALEPLNARAAVGLMRSLADAGDRSGALQHARVHETLVRQELNAAPDPAVAELAERLRQEPDVAASVGPAARTAASPTPTTVLAPQAASAPPYADGSPAEARAAPRATPLGLPLPRAETRRHRAVRVALPAGVAALAVAAMVGAAAVLRARRPPGEGAPVIAVGLIGDYTGADTTRLASALRGMLATNLARARGFQVVSNARMYEVLGQAGEREVSAATMARAARRAGATDVVEGALYRRPGGRLRFDVQRVQLATGAVRGAYTVEGDDPYELVDRATARLAAEFDVGADTLRVADVTTTSLVAYRLYQEGLRAFYHELDRPTALRLFAAALAEDSTFAMAAYYAGIVEISMGRGAFVNAYLAQALRMADRATERERLLIRGRWLSGWDEPEWLAVAESLATRYPTEPDGHLLLARALMVSGDFLGAVPHLRRVIAMDSLGLLGVAPGCRACEALGDLTSAYLAADSFPAAERVTREWERVQPRSTGPWQLRSFMLSASGRYAEALDALRAAEQRQQPDPRYYGPLRAIVAIRAADFAEADRLAAALASDSASLGEGRWMSFTSLRYQGRLREALPHARRLDTARVAQVLLEAGRPREAAALFGSVAAHPPFEPWQRGKVARHRAWYLTHTATALAAAGDTARLAAIADTVQATGPRSSLGRDRLLHHHIRGLLLAARGDSAGAERELRQAIVSPTFGYTRTNLELGRLLLTQRRPGEAVAVLSPALRGPLDASNTYVTHTELHELLARAFDAAGEADSAAAHYRWVVTAWRAADPPFRPRWEAARRRLGALQPGRVAAAR
jgi:DNA-binding SARP family transcriptional activator/TolB-like protein